MVDNSLSRSFFSMVAGKDVKDLEVSDENEDSSMFDETLSIDEASVSRSMVTSAEENKVVPEHLDSDTSGDLTTECRDQCGSDMPHDARRVLVHLMKSGAVMMSENSKLFESACRHEEIIRKHLSEVYLQLILDRKNGVSFVANASSGQGHDSVEADSESGCGMDEQEHLESEESKTLITTRTLRLYDTLILLVLRKHYQDRESAGEQKITIDVDRLESYLTPFLPITDHPSKDRRKLSNKMKDLKDKKILSNIRGSDNKDRYEITPIIRYVVDASFLESMLEEYSALASKIGCEEPDENASWEDEGAVNDI